MTRIIRVRYEIDASFNLSVFFECGFIIDESDDDLPRFGDITFFNKDQVTIFYTFLIHRVSLSSEEEVLISRREKLRRYRYLRLDILFGEDRHTTGDSTDERDITYFITICRILRRYFDIFEWISIEPTFLYYLIEKYRDRSGRSVSKWGLECTDRKLLSFRDVFSDFLEYELFFGGEFFHGIIWVTYNVYKRVYMYTFWMQIKNSRQARVSLLNIGFYRMLFLLIPF